MFESELKLGANSSDTVGFFPGHSGLLDRIDALLYAVLLPFVCTLLIA